MTHLLTLSPTFDQRSALPALRGVVGIFLFETPSLFRRIRGRLSTQVSTCRSSFDETIETHRETLNSPFTPPPLTSIDPLLLLRIIAMKSDHPQAACSSSRLLSGEKLTRGPLRCESISYRLQHLFETEGVIRSFFPVLSPFFSRIIPIISSICSSLREAS